MSKPSYFGMFHHIYNCRHSGRHLLEGDQRGYVLREIDLGLTIADGIDTERSSTVGYEQRR